LRQTCSHQKLNRSICTKVQHNTNIRKTKHTTCVCACPHSSAISNMCSFIVHNMSNPQNVVRLLFNVITQGRSQEFATEGTKEGAWGTEVPQRGPGAEPRWGLGAKPQMPETVLISSYDGGNMHPCPPGYTTVITSWYLDAQASICVPPTAAITHSNIWPCIATLTLWQPWPCCHRQVSGSAYVSRLKPDQFVCRLNYVVKQSSVKFRPLDSKISRWQDARMHARTDRQPENIVPLTHVRVTEA